LEEEMQKRAAQKREKKKEMLSGRLIDIPVHDALQDGKKSDERVKGANRLVAFDRIRTNGTNLRTNTLMRRFPVFEKRSVSTKRDKQKEVPRIHELESKLQI
jgi:hypothetical protein